MNDWLIPLIIIEIFGILLIILKLIDKKWEKEGMQ